MERDHVSIAEADNLVVLAEEAVVDEGKTRIRRGWNDDVLSGQSGDGRAVPRVSLEAKLEGGSAGRDRGA
jgi:hypothetical protein